jgi:hypothetical protein
LQGIKLFKNYSNIKGILKPENKVHINSIEEQKEKRSSKEKMEIANKMKLIWSKKIT